MFRGGAIVNVEGATRALNFILALASRYVHKKYQLGVVLLESWCVYDTPLKTIYNARLLFKFGFFLAYFQKLYLREFKTSLSWWSNFFFSGRYGQKFKIRTAKSTGLTPDII